MRSGIGHIDNPRNAIALFSSIIEKLKFDIYGNNLLELLVEKHPIPPVLVYIGDGMLFN